MITARWIGRALLLALLAWWTWRPVPHPLDWSRINASFLHLVNLPFHEAGHIVIVPFGECMTVLGGSLLQGIIPLVCVTAFARRGDWFSVAVACWWAGENLIDLRPYIGDPRALQMRLIGGTTGAEVEGHDWEAILERLGWLHLDKTLGTGAHVFGSVLMIGSVVYAAWMLLTGSWHEPVDA